MTPIQKRAIEYVKNTNDGATRSHFIEDHEPIGELLWEDLWEMNAIHVDIHDVVRLTPEGEKLLNE